MTYELLCINKLLCKFLHTSIHNQCIYSKCAPPPNSKKEVTTATEPLNCLNFVCIQNAPPPPRYTLVLSQFALEPCVSKTLHAHCCNEKTPPSYFKKSFIFALHSWIHFCVRLLFDLYKIHPPPDYQIFFVSSCLVNKIERPTSYNIYVGISFTIVNKRPPHNHLFLAL